jgi:hypothetical protein
MTLGPDATEKQFFHRPVGQSNCWIHDWPTAFSWHQVKASNMLTQFHFHTFFQANMHCLYLKITELV